VIHVIGTAGHVDHGKSTLIQALTGVHPDRLKEEREREMTIDLGFAWITLPGKKPGEFEEVGIVDVPGHRDFIENMLAGVGGIDAALLVVAADEGAMPQTREHLAILDILQVKGGVVALNKVDLVDDPEWLVLVENDLHQVFLGTVLEDAPIVRVSAKTGFGISELKHHLSETLREQAGRPDLKRPRLPVDRVFTMPGFGTVVTGTLVDGSLQIGDEVEILASGRRGRVRGLQTHKHKEQSAIPGSRTAVNISGVALDEIQRGDTVAHPGQYRPTQRIDVFFRLLPDVTQPLKHNDEVKLFIGTTEVLARLRLLGLEELAPGEEGWLQLETYHPIVAMRGDRYILRRPSPGETLGGGEVVDPHPKGRHKRFARSVLSGLEMMAKGSPEDIFLQAFQAAGPVPLKDVLPRANLDREIAVQALSSLYDKKQIVALDVKSENGLFADDDLWVPEEFWQRFSQCVLSEVKIYHQAHPLRGGMPREELKSRLNDPTMKSARFFNAAIKRLIAENMLPENGPVIHLPSHKIQFSAEQQRLIDHLLAQFSAAPYAPPSVKECQTELGDELFNALIETGKLVTVSPEVVFRAEDYQQMVADVREMIRSNGTITVAQGRDHFQTSRKYVLALLERLDSIGVTVRAGDERRLKKLMS